MSLADQYEAVVAGVSPAWLALLGAPAALRAVLGEIPAAGVVPAPHQILEAFRLVGEPSQARAVIIGQDPYPDPLDAHGLSFSVSRGRAVPPSLQRVFGCLDRAGLRRPPAAPCGDLRPWAAQGVLLLNAALTTRAGERGAHAALWKAFVGEALGALLAGRKGGVPPPLHVLLWGGDAKAFAGPARRGGAVVHEWSHPSPLADNRLTAGQQFRDCPHFEAVNADIAAAGGRPIVWDNLAPVVVFTDGSCSGNGQIGAAAGYAAVITGGQFGCTVVKGPVASTEYELVDAADPGRGFRPKAAAGFAAPSNNRGELLGLCAGLLAALAGRALGRLEVISDSEISLKTLKEWLPARRAKGTAHELKNFDLVEIAERLLGAARAQSVGEVVLTHTRSHRAEPPKTASVRERFIWAGNNKADIAAGEGAKMRGGDPVAVSKGPAVVAQTFAAMGADPYGA